MPLHHSLNGGGKKIPVMALAALAYCRLVLLVRVASRAGFGPRTGQPVAVKPATVILGSRPLWALKLGVYILRSSVTI